MKSLTRSFTEFTLKVRKTKIKITKENNDQKISSQLRRSAAQHINFGCFGSSPG
jgi:hypothetical protein